MVVNLLTLRFATLQKNIIWFRIKESEFKFRNLNKEEEFL